MKKLFLLISIFFILVFNFWIRVYGGKNSPVNINWDEASIGYNAYSLMLTGKDEYGIKFPVSLRSFNDYKPALYAYLTIPFIKIFGLNTVSLRMTSAFWGTLSLIPLLLLIKLFLGEWKMSLIYWLLLSLGPMRIHFSRVALESNISMSFFSFGGYWLINYLIKKKKSDFILAILGFILAMFSYHSARMAAPGWLFLIIMDPISWLIDKKWKVNTEWKKMIVGLIVLALAFVPLFLNSGSGALTRLNQENIWAKFYPFTPRGLFDNTFIGWTLENPIYYLLGILTGHVSAYLSPFNLVSNQYHWIRNSVMYIPGYNVMGLIESLFFVLGIFWIFKNLSDLKYRYLIYWFLAAISPAVVTWNWLHTLRVSNGLIVFDLLVIFGLNWFGSLINKKMKWLIIAGLLLMFSFQFIYETNNELVYSNVENEGQYQPGGFKEGVPIIKELMGKYDKVIVDSPQANPYIFFLFYLNYDPFLYQNKNNVTKVVMDDGSIGYNFGNIEFRRINWAEDQKLKKTILWMKPGTSNGEIEAVTGATLIKSIVSPIKDYVSAVIVTLD